MISDDVAIFWAKTYQNSRDQEVPGISVLDHCVNVGWVAHNLVERLPRGVTTLLPGDDGRSTAVLAALHDIGKITLGFQTKCLAWTVPIELGDRSKREASLSICDHALVSQVFLQDQLKAVGAHLWAAAIGAHHGRPKGRNVKRLDFEACDGWAEANRKVVAQKLINLFGSLPKNLPSHGLVQPILTCGSWPAWSPSPTGSVPMRLFSQWTVACRRRKAGSGLRRHWQPSDGQAENYG